MRKPSQRADVFDDVMQASAGLLDHQELPMSSRKRTRQAIKEEPEEEAKPVVESASKRLTRTTTKPSAGSATSTKQPTKASSSRAKGGKQKAVKKEEDEEEDVVKEEEEEEEEDDIPKWGPPPAMSEYEKQRLETIRKNQEYLESLGLGDVKASIGLTAAALRMAQKRKASTKGVKPVKREPREPTRRSGRLEGKEAPFYNQEKLIQEPEYLAQAEVQRMDEGPLTLETLNRSEEGGEAFLELLKALVDEGEGGGSSAEGQAHGKGKKATLDYASRLAKLSMKEEDVAKLTPRRATALVIHPSEKTLVVVSGDVDGNLGVWKVDSPGNTGVFSFKPHVDKIASMQYAPHNPALLYSASHDGTIRCLDIQKQIFDLVVATGEDFTDSGFTCANISPVDVHSLYLAGHEGAVGRMDLRSKKFAFTIQGHDKKANSIEAHPTQEHYFVTGSTDRMIKLWDARKPKTALWAIPHTNSLNNVTFNPTGEYMLSTCQDHKLYVYKEPLKLSSPTMASAKHVIKHNNNTGRWLSKFWPTWDPKEPTAFVIGSLEQPRRIEVFTADGGYQIASLQSEFMNSVQSVNVFHPTLNLVVGANSSGRLHLYR